MLFSSPLNVPRVPHVVLLTERGRVPAHHGLRPANQPTNHQRLRAQLFHRGIFSRLLNCASRCSCRGRRDSRVGERAPLVGRSVRYRLVLAHIESAN